MENELNEVRISRETFYFDLISSKLRKTTFLKTFELFTFEHFGEFSSIFVLILLKNLSSFNASSVSLIIAITSMPSALRSRVSSVYVAHRCAKRIDAVKLQRIIEI